MSETPHVTSLRKQFALNRLSAAHRFRVADDQVEKYAPELPEQDIEEVLADYLLEPGQLVEGRGIFVGTWTPEDSNGKSLSQTFNVFAAPEDLAGAQEWHTYYEALKSLALLKNWHGHNGTYYASDKELCDALAAETYTGGWVIPPREILCGSKIYSEGRLPDNLLAHKDTGAFNGAFDRRPDDYDGFPGWYWSSTKHPRDTQEAYAASCLSENKHGWRPTGTRGPCRPVRLEPKP